MPYLAISSVASGLMAELVSLRSAGVMWRSLTVLDPAGHFHRSWVSLFLSPRGVTGAGYSTSDRFAADSLPPGDYRVVTDEEVIEGLSFTAYHRISTEIFVPAEAGCAVEMMTIDPMDLQAVHEQDVAMLPCTPWWEGRRTLLPPRRRWMSCASQTERLCAAMEYVS